MNKYGGNNKTIYWDGFNNIGIGAVAIGTVLNFVNTLSIPKALLIVPLIIHNPTVSFISKKNTRARSSAALVSNFPEFF
ncbi:hypothetical protein [Kosakonia radicincitans]|uniref:hypothetical protein n=1 Tax=Kosakonia radicincitans TaxID=283686 RepID=UPI001D06392A|nr:hypothetical protein [Kosakonia radicincitans]